MNVAELEQLLERVTQGNWKSKEGDKTLIITVDVSGIGESMALRKLMTAAPALARRVIAAEKLADAVRYDLSCWPDTMEGTLRDVLQAYEATK